MSSAVSCQCRRLFCFCAPDWFYTVLPPHPPETSWLVMSLWLLCLLCIVLACDPILSFTVFQFFSFTVFQFYSFTVLPPPPPETSWLMVSYVTPSLATVQSGAELVVVVGQKSDIIWSIYNEEQRPWAHWSFKSSKGKLRAKANFVYA